MAMKFESDNFRGAALMSLSMAGFVINDGFMRQVLIDLPLVQAVFLRGIILTLFLALLAWRRGALRVVIPPADRRRIRWRAGAELAGTFTFLTALSLMPFAQLSAVMQFLPLSVTLGAALFLGHRVGARRIAAIMAGFLGVLLIVRPGIGGWDFTVFLVLATVAIITLRDLATRSLSPAAPSILVALITAASVTVVCGLLSLGINWAPVSRVDVISMIAAALVLVVGYVASVAAMRVGDISFVAPFRYSSLLWAIVIGMFVFDEWPDALTLLGAAIVVATGIYAFARESRVRS